MVARISCKQINNNKETKITINKLENSFPLTSMSSLDVASTALLDTAQTEQVPC